MGLQDLLRDGDFLFAFTYARDDSNRVLVDVFDTGTGTYVSSAWLRSGPVMALGGGRLYIRGDFRNEGKAPTITRYRLVPEVYGRR